MRHVQMTPFRHFHLLPLAESVQAEVKQPLWFTFPFGNHAHDVLVQAIRNKVLIHIGDESFFIFFLRYILKKFLFFVNVHIVTIYHKLQSPESEIPALRIYKVSIFTRQ